MEIKLQSFNSSIPIKILRVDYWGGKMKSPIKFVKLESNNNPIDQFVFDKMTQKIAAEAHISPTIVKKYSQRAITGWEQKTGHSIVNLCHMTSVDRSTNIYNILDELRHSLEPFVPSVKTLDKSMCIASISMELMLKQF